MTLADWRALLEAYIAGRLSASAFVRRFLQGLRDGERAPGAIADMASVVEAFDAEGAETDIDVADDRELSEAARRALGQLREAGAPTAHTFDRTRAREDVNRFSMQVSGCAGAGCVIALIWVALCVLQITFVSEWVQTTTGMSAWPSAFLGFFLAFVPIVGNLLAFLDATGARDWPVWLAAIVFFAAPAATLVSGWMRWRRFR